MNVLQEWTELVTRELGVDLEVDRDAVLDMARDVAHGVARPAAPLTAFLAGLAAGRGDGAEAVLARVSRLADQWAAAHPEPTEP